MRLSLRNGSIKYYLSYTVRGDTMVKNCPNCKTMIGQCIDCYEDSDIDVQMEELIMSLDEIKSALRKLEKNLELLHNAIYEMEE